MLTAFIPATAHYDGPGPWWPIIPLVWFLLFATFIVVVARTGWFGRRRWAERHDHDGRHSGESRLAERFAAGEIDEDEYRARLGVLREASPRA